MNDATKPLLDHDPCPNVINKEEFDSRVATIFKQVGEILGRSAGPCGAPAIISQYPYYHMTKDGYTIRKNISYEKSDGFLDQVISDLCGNICDRLNFAVGDGTTAAILVTCAIYDYYTENKEVFDELFIRPRDIINYMEKLKGDIIKGITEQAFDIRSLSKDEMIKQIHDVVYISSNGNEEITDMITNLYEQIEYPAITVELASDGQYKTKVIDGYFFAAALADHIYTNNDNHTMVAENCDILIYDHRISLETYENTLKPMSQFCRQRQRKLICLAPFYDTTALGVMAQDLNREKEMTKSANLVLMSYRNSGELMKKKISDFAMLCGTQLISQYTDNELNRQMRVFLDPDSPKHEIPINIDRRFIENIHVAIGASIDGVPVQKMVPYSTDVNVESLIFKDTERSVRLGFIGNVTAGMKDSTFRNFHFNRAEYESHLNEAETELKDAIDKYKTMGGFNLEINQKQDRLLSLKMKMGIIYVGADTEFSQTYNKDVVDDAVKAAESAFNNGIIKGCHVTINRVIMNMKHKYDNLSLESATIQDKRNFEILHMLSTAYKAVYKRILLNASENNIEIVQTDDVNAMVDAVEAAFKKVFKEPLVLASTEWTELEGMLYKDTPENTTLYDVLINLSLRIDKVFDLSTLKFTDNVINSTATDREILKASIDLIGLLITGNQLLISRPR